MQFFWPAIQQAQGGPYTWSHVDYVVALAAAHGITVLPTLFGTPPFENGCSSRDCQVRLPIATPQQRADWSAFVSAAAKRYGPGGEFWSAAKRLDYHPIRTWQIWNEPNNFNALGRPRSTAPEYADLVEAAHTALLDVDPQAQTAPGRDVRHAERDHRSRGHGVGVSASGSTRPVRVQTSTPSRCTRMRRTSKG